MFVTLLHPFTYMIWQSQRKGMGDSYGTFLLPFSLAFLRVGNGPDRTGASHGGGNGEVPCGRELPEVRGIWQSGRCVCGPPALHHAGNNIVGNFEYLIESGTDSC